MVIKVTAGFIGTWRTWFVEVLSISAVVSPVGFTVVTVQPGTGVQTVAHAYNKDFPRHLLNRAFLVLM
jgi:hypothetical protein